MAARRASPSFIYICICSADVIFAGPPDNNCPKVLFFAPLQLILASVLRRIACPCGVTVRGRLCFSGLLHLLPSYLLLPRLSNQPRRQGKLSRSNAFIRSRA